MIKNFGIKDTEKIYHEDIGKYTPRRNIIS